MSQVFIKRELQGLRACGLDVQAIAVRRTPITDLLAPDDVDEYEATLALLPVSPSVLVRAHVRGLAHPWAYIRTLVHAVARRGPGRIKQLCYFGECMLLLRVLRARDLAYLHVHFLNNAAEIAYLARYFSRLTGGGLAGYSITLHGPTDFYDVTRWRLREKVAASSGVVAISYFARSQVMVHMSTTAATPIRVSYYGVEPVAPPVVARSKVVTVLCVGRLVPAKGHRVLLEAIGRLVTDGLDFRCLIVGDGPLRPLLESEARRLHIESRVELLGALGSSDVAVLYSKADIFCLPSLAEGLPVVLIEAMSFGIPVIATRIAGVPELVADGESGMLVTPGRSEELSVALRMLICNESERLRLGAEALRTVTERFDHASASRRLTDVLTEFHQV